MACLIASQHAARDIKRGGNCDCIHCQGDCACDDEDEGYDEETPLIDPEEIGR